MPYSPPNKSVKGALALDEAECQFVTGRKWCIKPILSRDGEEKNCALNKSVLLRAVLMGFSLATSRAGGHMLVINGDGIEGGLPLCQLFRFNSRMAKTAPEQENCLIGDDMAKGNQRAGKPYLGAKTPPKGETAPIREYRKLNADCVDPRNLLGRRCNAVRDKTKPATGPCNAARRGKIKQQLG